MSARRRVLRLAVASLLAVAAAGLCFVLARPALEGRLRARLEREARQLGLAATLGSLRLTPALSLELRDLVLENRQVRVRAGRVLLRPRLSLLGIVGRAATLELSDGGVELPGGAFLDLAPSRWLVERGFSEWRLQGLNGPGRLAAQASAGPRGPRLAVQAVDLPLARLARLRVHGCTLARPGVVDAEARLERGAADAVSVSLRLRARGFALASWVTSGSTACGADDFGAPTDATLETDGELRLAEGSLRAERLRVIAGGAEATGRLSLDGGLADPRVDVVLEVPRLDFAALLATASLDLPASDLGSAALALHVSGPLLDPSALTVTQRLDFTPPARPLPAIERLRGPFVHRALAFDGRQVEIAVGPESPDFVALADVPPLFVRTLLIAEDAGFYGHHGIDLGELPLALATNLVRGRFARGASTIPQQLAKNLFLSGRKTLSRKLEEASLALLLDASLGKPRELEIYLNVIEWGPALYGLRPAARHYFGCEPSGLTPKQVVFLVSLIPGPLKYQRSFPQGVPTPFFEGLMATLLAKLLSIGALGPEQYEAALAEPLALRAGPDLTYNRGRDEGE